MRAKKSLGQNFLRSQQVATDLVQAANIRSNNIVLEVGPGRGMITQILLQKAKKVVAVEKDGELVRYLNEKFEQEISSGKLEIIHEDILKFNPKSYKLIPNSYKLVGAIPYYITSNLLRVFLSSNNQPKTIALIVQKEVAQRIVARGGKESLLSLSVKVYGTPRYVKTIKAGNFYPKPKVDSAIIAIENVSKNFFSTKNEAVSGKIDISEKKFFELLKVGFSSKRKKLITNLKKVSPKTNFEETFTVLNILQNIRAEDMSLKQWQKLFLTPHNKN